MIFLHEDQKVEKVPMATRLPS